MTPSDKITTVLQGVRDSEWRSIPGFEGRYEAGNMGGIRSLDRMVNSRHGMRRRAGVTIHPGNDGRYLTFTTMGQSGKRINVSVARCVAAAFIPNPEKKPTVNHINGVKTDNRVCNLEWSTHREQQIHALSTGLHKRVFGEDCASSKLKDSEIEQIKSLKGVFTERAIATRFGISSSHVHKIFDGSRRAILTGDKP